MKAYHLFIFYPKLYFLQTLVIPFWSQKYFSVAYDPIILGKPIAIQILITLLDSEYSS